MALLTGVILSKSNLDLRQSRRRSHDMTGLSQFRSLLLLTAPLPSLVPAQEVVLGAAHGQTIRAAASDVAPRAVQRDCALRGTTSLVQS